MSVLTFYQPYSMLNPPLAYSINPSYSSTTVTLSSPLVGDGFGVSTYRGSFTYPNDSISGTVTSYDYKENNVLVLQFTGSIDAYSAFYYVGEVLDSYRTALVGDDTITGGAGSQVISGFRGNDTIDLGSGIDTVFFKNSASNYSIQQIDLNTYRVTDNSGYDGTDTLKNIEKLKFGSSREADINSYLTEYYGELSYADGTFTFADGSTAGGKYVGYIKDGNHHGEGTLEFTNGHKYVGNWVNDTKEGQGTFTWTDGAQYAGQWEDNNFNGDGTYTWPDGMEYTGRWLDTKRFGDGTQTWPSGEKYVGNWVDGIRSGQGIMNYANGDVYEGEWLNDSTYLAKGILTYANGAKYITGDETNETHTGSEYADEIYPYWGNDEIKAMGGDDRIHNNRGDDTVYGGEGKDTYFIDWWHDVGTWSIQKRTDGGFNINHSADGSMSPDNTRGNDVIYDVERIEFTHTDMTVALDIDAGDTAGQAYRLYQAAFARTPDMPGVAYHMNDMESNGLSIQQIASNFMASPEFKNMYGENPTDDEYINALYQNVLGRGASSDEVGYYQERFDNGTWDRPQVMINFAESPENIALVGPDIANGIWLPDV